MQKGEIVYCNLLVLFNNKKTLLKEVVYKETDGFYKNTRLGITSDAKVLEVDIIKSLGFENSTHQFSTTSKSDEVRNKITGVYE